MKNRYQILLDRRKEIQEQINKLNDEYTAIGEVLHELFEYKQNEKDKEEDEEYEL